MKVNVLYGSSTGNTKEAAELIARELEGTAISITDAKTADFKADLLVFGTSTWGIGDLQDDWASAMAVLEKIDWKNQKVALFCMGDQIGFADSYIDGVRVIYDLLVKEGAVMLGKWSVCGYRYNSSRAQIGDCFVGLALDADNEMEKTPERVKAWCSQLRNEAEL